MPTKQGPRTRDQLASLNDFAFEAVCGPLPVLKVAEHGFEDVALVVDLPILLELASWLLPGVRRRTWRRPFSSQIVLSLALLPPLVRAIP